MTASCSRGSRPVRRRAPTGSPAGSTLPGRVPAGIMWEASGAPLRRSSRSSARPRRVRCAPCHRQPEGSEHATGRGRRAHDQLRRAGRGRAAPADPLHCPPTTPATRSSCRPTPSTSAASRSTFPARARATSRPGRTRPRATPTRSPPSSARSGSSSAHVAGVSLGAGVAMHLAARHPGRVRSLSLHSAWDTSDRYLKTVVELWRTLASSLPTVADVVIQGDLPAVLHARDVRRAGRSSWTRWSSSCGAAPPSRWTRSWPRPRRPSRTTRAPVLGEIGAPTLITFGAHDLVCSTRFAEPLEQRDRRERAGGLRAPVARRAARGPRDLQPRDARLPAAPARVTRAPRPHLHASARMAAGERDQTRWRSKPGVDSTRWSVVMHIAS